MFQVAWLRTALDELADVSARADSSGRKAITVAAHAIEQRLKVNPQNEGESREQERRILFQEPLAASFEVVSRQRVVRVLHVWSIRRSG